MWITARKACRLLAVAGVSQRCALRVLASGLAGESVHAGSVLLYDEARVVELAERPSVPWTELEGSCPAGFFVSRREFPATASRREQVAALSRHWGSVNPWRWTAVAHQISHHGSFPFVATIGGLVVLGADIVEVHGLCELVLQPPGPWFEAVQGCWLPTGRGRPWFLQLGPLARARSAA